MKKKRTLIILIASIGLLAASCASGGDLATNDDYVSMSNEIAQLEGTDPGDNPKVELKLKHANDNLERAKSAIQEEEYEEAELWLQRAKVDAQLAESMIQRDKQIDSVLAVYEDIDDVREDMSMQ